MNVVIHPEWKSCNAIIGEFAWGLQTCGVPTNLRVDDPVLAADLGHDVYVCRGHAEGEIK